MALAQSPDQARCVGARRTERSAAPWSQPNRALAAEGRTAQAGRGINNNETNAEFDAFMSKRSNVLGKRQTTGAAGWLSA